MAVVRRKRARSFCEVLIFRADVIEENFEIKLSVGLFGFVTLLGHLDVIFHFMTRVNKGSDKGAWGEVQRVRRSTNLSLQTAMQVAFEILYGGLNPFLCKTIFDPAQTFKFFYTTMVQTFARMSQESQFLICELIQRYVSSETDTTRELQELHSLIGVKENWVIKKLRKVKDCTMKVNMRTLVQTVKAIIQRGENAKEPAEDLPLAEYCKYQLSNLGVSGDIDTQKVLDFINTNLDDEERPLYEVMTTLNNKLAKNVVQEGSFVTDPYQVFVQTRVVNTVKKQQCHCII
jgi:hypothetical protein